jgi:hypothetical protein
MQVIVSRERAHMPLTVTGLDAAVAQYTLPFATRG